jgi:uncharacterized surface protein with fasciclin (FAS1) repeats
VKKYSNTLNYSLGNENFLKTEDNDGQKDGYTLFAPTDAVLIPYINNTLLEFYVPDASQRTAAKLNANLAILPANILADFMNAHMFQTTVWPSKFGTTKNSSGEPARFDAATNVVDKQFCSNGIFYGVNQVQQANVFSTVYGRAYLDPAYSIMTRLINSTVKTQLTTTGSRFTIFMLSDAQLNALGYAFDAANNYYTYTANGTTTTGLTPLSNLQRILSLNIVPTPNNEMNNLAGDGIIETNGGEYIRWHNNTVSSGATVEQNKTLTIAGSRDYSNGRIYFLSGGILDAPTKTVAADILANAGTTTSPYYDFYTYLVSSTVYNTGTLDILGIQPGANYTVFIPTKAAMQQAVIDGYLPGVTAGSGASKTFVSFNYKPTSSEDKDLVAKFIYYHILNGITIAPDGKKGVTGIAFPTMLKTITGDALNVITFNQPGNLRLQDNKAQSATVLPPNNASYFPATSNYLGNHVLLHQIDNYLRYNF